VAGDWVIRDLNTLESNGISGLTLSSNQITLPAGTYHFYITCPGFNMGAHRARLRTVGGTTLLLGSSANSNAGDPSTTESIIVGRVVLGSTTALVIDHRANAFARPFGNPSNFGVNEVYTICSIEKLK
jgi:hypothetical protein